MPGLSRCVWLLLVSACHCYRYPTEVADPSEAAVPSGAATLVPSVAADSTFPPAAEAIAADALAATPAHTVKDGLASVTTLDQITRSVNLSHLLVGGVPSPMLPSLCPNSITPTPTAQRRLLVGTRPNRSSLALPRAPSASSRARRGTYRSVDTSASGTTRSGFGTTACTRT